MYQKIFSFVRVFIALFITYLLAKSSHTIFALFEHGAEAELLTAFFVIAMLCVLSFGVFYLSTGTGIPSFVIALFFGMIAKPFLEPVIENEVALGALVGFGATFILFGGGLETPFENFKKLFWKILSLSFVGLFITSLSFSLIVAFFGELVGSPLPLIVSILLGAVLASTDPASIIPILRQLRFSNRDTKDIIVSESAMTDVTGTLVTVALLSVIVAGGTWTSIFDGYADLFSKTAGGIVIKQMVFGGLFGFLGYLLLAGFTRFKKRHDQEFEPDAAFFFFVPIMTFTVTIAFGGSGYLAAFIAGLLFVLSEHLHDTERFFNQTIDGFLKPIIFLLLGALVEFDALMEYAAVGVLSALVFIFIIRPLSVFIALGPFSFFGKNRFSVRELLFISFVRETGAIPAVLLITIISMGIPGLDGLIPIGMWIILITLVIQPPLTPIIAKLLKVGSDIKDEKDITLHGSTEPFVLLGSRGYSFIRRLPKVADWVERHHIQRVVLLHCLEDRYTPELVAEIGKIAEEEFKKVNEQRKKEGHPPIQFQYVSRKGFLQENIESLAEEHDNLTLIFVSRKMLDYKLPEIKKMAVPLFFIE